MGNPAARVGDMHVCPMFDGPKPHVGGPIMPPGVPTVLLGNLPAAQFSNLCTCASAPATILNGSTGVFISNMPAARLMDPTAHGGMITVGLPTVLIGEINMSVMTPVILGLVLKLINPTNSTTNCADIITSVIALFRGNGPLEAPIGAGQSDEEINANNHSTIGPYNRNIHDIFADVQSGGPGTVKIMAVNYTDANGDVVGGHVVVVANVNGQAGVMEAQDWGPGQESGFVTDPAVAEARYGYGGSSTYATADVP